MRALRWLLCIPFGFVASVVVGALTTVVTDYTGGASWYI